MQIVDANVLIYAVDTRAPMHERARSWLDAALLGPETLGFAWIVLLAFLRISTHPSIFPRRLTVEQAIEILEVWLSARVSALVEPTHRHAAVLTTLVRDTGSAGNLVNDAHLAALALEHRATVVSFDRDFQRFEGVRWRLPTAP